MKDSILEALREAQSALSGLIGHEQTITRIEAAASLMISAFGSGRRVFSCGNGGSMSDAIHFAEELTGRYRKNRRPLPTLAISDAGHISCVGNDFGYDEIFSRFVEAHGAAGDILLAISTSGKSANVVRAAETAKARGMKVVVLTGVSDSALGKLADVEISTPGGRFADRVQELHIKVIHILIEMVEREFFPELYA